MNMAGTPTSIPTTKLSGPLWILHDNMATLPEQVKKVKLNRPQGQDPRVTSEVRQESSDYGSEYVS